MCTCFICVFQSGRTVKRVSFSDSNPNVVLQPNRQPTSSGAKKGAIKPVAQHSAHPGDDTIAPAHKNNTGFRYDSVNN